MSSFYSFVVKINERKRGHEKFRNHKHNKREPKFFAIEISKSFNYCTNWYRQGAVGGLVLDYYFILRSVLRTKPHLRHYVTRCRHCRIFFISDPRNAGRTDLGCPFGCSAAHRRESSTRRSVAYYQAAVLNVTEYFHSCTKFLYI